MGGGGGGVLGAVGGVVGGLIGQSAASGYASQASNEAGISNQIMQEVAAAPDIQKPLILEQYRQAGILTPAMEQQISLGVSQASQVKANPQLQAAQQQALQQMSQRSQQGLTATDRAAFNQLQSQVGAATQGRAQSILQQMRATTGGQGSQGAQLAALLQNSQQGANTEAMNSDQLAAQAQQASMAALSQYGNMAGQMNQQQFGQQLQAAQAADAFRQFDVQNQVAQQARNTQAQNQAQQYNLNLGQNLSNANVSQANQEQYNQLQRQAQEWQMNYQRATGQSQAAAGYGNTLSGMAQQKAQAGANLGAGIGGIASSVFTPGASESGSFAKGGEVPGYADGGPISNPFQLSPIQIAGMQAPQAPAFIPYNMPQRQAFTPMNFTPSTGQPSSGKKKAPKSSKGSTPTEADAEQAANQAAPLGPGVAGPVGPAQQAADEAAPLSANQAGPVGPRSQQAEDTSDASQAAQQDESSYSGQMGPYSQDAGIDPSETDETISQGDSAYSAAGDVAQALGGMNRGGKVRRRYDDGGEVDTGIDPNAPSSSASGIDIAGAQMPQAVAADTGNAAPPPRPQADFAAPTFAGPPQQKSGGGGGGGASGIASMLPMLAMLANKGGEAPGDYRSGGKVPGKAKVQGDHPKNDTVKAMLSPGEIVLPRTIAEKLKGAPDADFNERLNKIVGPFIRKSQAKHMADGGQVDKSQYEKDMQAGYERNVRGMSRPPQSDFEIETEAQAQRDADQRAKDRNPFNQPLSQANGPRYADGGEAQDNGKPSAWDQLKKNLSDQFAKPTPEPTPTEEETREEKYEKIRAQNRANMGYAKGGKVTKKNALSILRELNKGYAEGDEVQPDSTPTPDDEDDDSVIVRANPDSDKEIDKLAQNEFQEDEDRSREPASLEDVEKEMPQESAEESQAKTQAAIDAVKGDEDQGPAITKDTIDNLYEDPNEPDEDEKPVKSSEETVTSYQRKLMHAQAIRRSLLAGAEGAKYGSLIAAGLAGHGAQPVNPAYFDNKALAELPVKDIAEQAAMEKEDPNSAVSKFYRQYLHDKMGIKNIGDDVSASGLEKLFPAVTRVIGGQYQLEKAKTMEQIKFQNRQALQDSKQDWQAGQKDLDRKASLQGRQIMADALAGRVEPTVINTAVNQVESDPVLKPLRMNQQTTSLSLDMLEKKDLDGKPFPVNAQMLADASNGFTQALTLRPGAITQKRYDATKIDTLKRRLTSFIGQYTDNPDIDMRTVDPALYNTLHDYLKALNQDYSGRLDTERHRLYNEKIAAFQASGRGNIVKGLQGAAGVAGPQGRPVTESKGNVSADTLKDYATKHKLMQGDGKTPDLNRAAKLLKDAGYVVEGY